MVNHRVWTTESAQAWREARDERRRAMGLDPYSVLTPQRKETALRVEKETLIKEELSVLTTQAWDIGKHPIMTYRAPFSGILLLPKNYHATGGMDRLKIYQDDDLNRTVYHYYDRQVDVKTYPGPNYVSNDGFRPKRHEYMGPSPHVACYRFTRDTIEIEWWESYIKDTWIGTKRWNVEAEFDEVVEGWFLIDRNEVSVTKT